MTEFPERLREAMDLRGVSQKHVAESAKTTEATISRYITGKNSPAILGFLRNIATALDVSTDFLLGVTNIPTSKDDMTSEEKIILSAWSRVSEDDKRVFYALLDKYLSQREKDIIGRK